MNIPQLIPLVRVRIALGIIADKDRKNHHHSIEHMKYAMACDYRPVYRLLKKLGAPVSPFILAQVGELA